MSVYGLSALELWFWTGIVRGRIFLIQRGAYSAPAGLATMDFALEKRQKLFSYSLLIPLFVMVAGIQLFPIIYAFVLSFTDRELFSTSWNFTGLLNYRYLVESEEFWESLINNIVYAGSCVVFQITVGLSTSLLLIRKFKGNYYFRAIVTFPYLVPTIVAVLIFKWMFNDVFGIVNRALVSMGILDQAVGWFDPDRAMFSVVLVSVWRFFPFTILLFVPALEAIPGELYEAARVDGASPVQQFFHITLPEIREVLFVVIILRGIWMFNNFNVIWLLTGGGPAGATQHLPILSYLQAFQEFDIGLGSATSVAGLLVLLVPMLIYLRSTKK
ncbi:MAG: sugar ABC transporter permease [Deltaproteobacteria bacterium]|nr:sugar ABC transporter permease [Deltaproteobacteria bacterium]MBW2122522.1 sugar ABC transporter permease [Deltaproteobacteria bacterium]